MRLRGRTRFGDEEGFTLLELTVVLVVLAALIAIAVPNFWKARDRAADKTAQRHVRDAYVATRLYYTELLTYTEDTTTLETVEPNLEWTSLPLDSSSTADAVYIGVHNDLGPGQTVIVGGRSPSGKCFYLKDVAGGTGGGTFFGNADESGGACPELTPAQVAAGSWAT